MRIRSTKPEFWRSERIASVSWEDRLLLKGLESYVDDNGVGRDDIALIVGDLFQRDLVLEPSGTLRKVQEGLHRLNLAGLLWRYEAEGTPLLYISFWEKAQYVQKAQRGRNPRPDGTFDYKDSVIGACSPEPSGTLRNVPALNRGTGEQGNRGTEEQNPPNPPRGEQRSKRGTRIDSDWMPTPELIEQMRSECPTVNLEAEHKIFIDYWIAQPGQKGVKTDWAATWRNWMRRKAGEPGRHLKAVPTRADETHDFISRLEAIDATRGSGEATGNHPELR